MHQLAYLHSYSRTHAFIHPATHSSTCPPTHKSIHTSYPKPQPIHPPTNCIFIPVLQAAAVYKQGAKRGLFLSQYQPTMVFHFCFTGSCCVQTRSRARSVSVSIPTNYSFSFLFYRQQGAERGLFLSKYQHTIVFHSCFTCSCCVQTRSRGRTVSVSIPTDYSFSSLFYRQLLCTNKEQSEVCFCLNTNQLCIFIPVFQAAAVYRQGAE